MAGSALIAKPGTSCWRRERAERASLLVDAATYFEAFAAAAERAERRIVIVGWDIDSRVKLRRQSRRAPTLRAFLEQLVRRRPDLEVLLLIWDHSVIYAAERQWFLRFHLGMTTSPRIRLHLDDSHPAAASQHQKIVVIDEAVAFVGGIDFTRARWDTPRHLPRDPRRCDAGESCAPFHDLELMVSGPAARSLGELARERWRRATGEELAPVNGDAAAVWPPSVVADFERIDVAITRTEPPHADAGAVREVEALHLDAIAAAKRLIYIENQYLSSRRLCEAMARRLHEPDGPEIVVLGPRQASGWLEASTMDVLRRRCLELLRAEDRYGRFGAFFPDRPGLRAGEFVNVHSKAMFVDDRMLRVGSANLSNRSMGLDSECDLAIEAAGRSDVAAAIARLRHTLLGEHLGQDPARVAEAVAAHGGSLLGAIRALDGPPGGRALRPLVVDVADWVDRAVPSRPAFDPDRPLDTDEILEQIAPIEHRRTASRGPLFKGLLLLSALLLVAALWRFSPLGEWVTPARLAELTGPLERSWWGPPVAILAFAAAALALVPITVLIVSTALVFGPWTAFLYSTTGALVSGAAAFAIGRRLRKTALGQLAGRRAKLVSDRLARGGVVSVVLLRLLPVAPYTIVNMLAGATPLRMGEFLVGTTIGLMPGILMMALVGDRVGAALRHPEPATIATAAVFAVVALAAAALLQLGLARRGAREVRS